VAEQLAAVTAEILRVEQTMQRYHQAFEAGTMAPEDCGSRLQELSAQVRELRCREEELELASSQSSSIQVDDSHLTDVHDAVREAIEGRTPQQKKALLKALSRRLKSTARKRRRPTGFRMPGFVSWKRGGHDGLEPSA
jgi:hypothetical protein